MPSTQVFAAGGISGQIWNDMDSGADQDVGEPGIRNVTVQLREAGTDTIFGTGDDVLYPNQVTDNSGNYSFTGLPDGGKFRLAVDFLSLPEGFDITTANEPQEITLGTNDTQTVNFGYKFGGKSSIGNYVWNDITPNGNWTDEGVEFSTGLSGVTMTLYLDMDGDGIFTPTLGNDLLLLQTVTDGTGKYNFPVSANGNDFFVLVDPSNFLPGGPLEGYLFTNPQGGFYSPDNPTYVPTTNLTEIITNVDFGYVQPATIGGTVYDDLSGNGAFNPGEPPITSGVVITLSNGLTTTTDVNGVYTFTNLLPGSYTIVEGDPAGYTSTGDTQGSLTDNTIAVTVTQGQSSLNNNFFDAKPTLIAGGVYDDLNGNGTQDGGEPPLSSVLITLSNGATTTTNASGLYTFTVMPGTYTVTETNPVNFTSTGAEAGTGTGTTSSVTNADTIQVTTTSGSTSVANDFLDQDPVTITGTVWDDKNAISGLTAGDGVIAGVVITLTGTDGLGNSVNVTTTTGANGVYTFTNVPAGSYTLVETDKTGYTSTGDIAGANNNQIPLTVTSGTDVTGQDFWDTLPVTIGGAVYDDLNGDGTQDSGEPVMSGVTVTLSTGAVTTTDASGLYTFTVLAGSYTVTETNPADYTSTGAEAGTNGSSVTNADTIQTATLTSGQTSLQNDFLDQDPVTITGTVWDDKNAISGLTAGDGVIAGVVITLTGTDGLGNSVNVTTTTGANGVYTFTNVPAGSYTLVETDKTGYTSTGDIAGANNNQIPLTVTSGTDVTGQDFWDTLPVTIGGAVYDDLNGDGTQDVGEPGMSGVTVTLSTGAVTTTDASGLYTFTVLAGSYTVTETNPAGYTSTGAEAGTNGSSVTNADTIQTATLTSGQTSLQNDFLDQDPVTITGTVWDDKNAISGLTAGDGVIAGVVITLTGTDGLGNSVNVTTTTGANGVYTFTNVPAGSYTLVETDKTGYTSTGDIAGANNNQIPLTVTSGTDVTGQDFWDTLPVTIGGAVYDDLDGDGVQNVGEPGLAGVTVTLSTGAVTTTDANGLYTFTVLAGTYTITETNPAGFTSTGAEAGTTGSSVTNADTLQTATLTSGQTSLQNDFLDSEPVTLTGSVFSDPAGNGTGTTGLPSVPITLTGTNGLGQSVTLTTTTDASGAYTFTNLLPGTYTLVETNPTGYKSTSDVQGSPTDDTIAVTITSGTNVTNQNFWDQAPLASIGDFVWYDVDGDGVQDSGEPGIPNVGISLTLPSGVVVNTTTDANGVYTFSNLAQGTYTVTVNPATLPVDFALTAGPDSAVSPLTVVLTQTQTYTTADFGFDVPTSYVLSKVLTTANPSRTGEVVQFRIAVTNTGKSVLTVLPMTDTFNHQYLQYVSASATPNFNLNGTLRWDDLTTAASVGDIQPSTSKFITVTFLALRDTYLSPGAVTTNTVTINNGLADPDGAGPLGSVEPLTPVTDDANVRIDGPTAVLLNNSQVKDEGGMVSINWTTVSENNILGFNIQRWDSQGRMTVVNAQPILAQLGGQAAGAVYTFMDLTVDSQELASGGYTYVLELLTLDGESVLVELGGPSALRYTLFMPLVIR